MIIDMRLRPPWKSIPSLAVYNFPPDGYAPEIKGAERPRSATERSMDLLFQEMDEAGIRCGVVMGRLADEQYGTIANEDIYELVDAYPNRFVGFPGVDSVRPRESLDELRQVAQHPKMPGVHLEPMGAAPARAADDRVYYPLYAEAERLGVIVAISGGGLMGPDFSYVDPIAIQRVARDFPGLTLIMCHGGWPWVHQAIAIAYSCPNVYVSPDMYMIYPEMPGGLEYVRAANLLLEDRIVFGTAYPTRPLPESVKDFHRLPFRDDHVKYKVLYATAARLLGLEN